MIDRTLPLPFLLCSALAVTGCATDPSICDQAEQHLRDCGADIPADALCDEAAAEDVLSMSCDDLRGDGPKADGICTIFTPWNCFPDVSADSTIEVAINECFGPQCPGLRGVGCGLAILEDDRGNEIARGFGNGSGRLTFEDLEPGDYVVKVLERDGDLATTNIGDFVLEFVPAALPITVEDGADQTWARFELEDGSTQNVTWCSDARIDFDATDSAGNLLDPEETEWNWFAVLTPEGHDDPSDITRALKFFVEEGHPGGNSFGLRDIFPGRHTLEFVRMDIPEHRRRNNPDYESLLRLFKVDTVMTIDLVIDAADVPADVRISQSIVDPLAP